MLSFKTTQKNLVVHVASPSSSRHISWEHAYLHRTLTIILNSFLPYKERMPRWGWSLHVVRRPLPVITHEIIDRDAYSTTVHPCYHGTNNTSVKTQTVLSCARRWPLESSIYTRTIDGCSNSTSYYHVAECPRFQVIEFTPSTHLFRW